MNLLKRIRVEQIEGCPGEGPYLTRWYLIERPNFRVYLHRFNRSDRDREMHDHPWSFLSFVLWGGYTEVTPWICDRDPILKHGGEDARVKAYALNAWRFGPRRRFYWPGSILFRRARWAHRIEIEDGKTAWSLVVTFKKERSWGFFTRDGWQPWRKFTTSRDCG